MNKDNTVRQAGGFIIQLMPFCDEKVIEKLEQRLAEVNSVTAFLDEFTNPCFISLSLRYLLLRSNSFRSSVENS